MDAEKMEKPTSLVGKADPKVVGFVENLKKVWRLEKITIIEYGLQLIAEKHGMDWPEGFGLDHDHPVYKSVPTPKPKQKK